MAPTTDIDNRLVDALRASGHRVTPQRLVIHRALRDLKRHASAEEVLGAVDAKLPGVSLPTVYATLELLEELGLARRVGPAGGRVLFDPRLDEHAHLVCSSCGRVEDIETGLDTARLTAAARRKGWRKARAGVVVTGVCSDCG
jgi:Fe2+ or Zn2+ uptake regulation protein